jgi:NarL family two-component system response regulator LiaR
MSEAARVLVVDDQSEMRLLAGALIESAEGLEVVAEASSEAEALERAGEADVALVDVVIPPGDDLDVARALHRSRPDLRLVIWSADVDDGLRERAAAAGAAACVSKGQLSELQGALRGAAGLS